MDGQTASLLCSAQECVWAGKANNLRKWETGYNKGIASTDVFYNCVSEMRSDSRNTRIVAE